MNSLTYLTRTCPRNCQYCALKKSIGKEVRFANDWIRAFHILKEMGVQFNLILGNETWVYEHELPRILEEGQLPYALYTTCPRTLFLNYWSEFFQRGIDNLSCGIDYPYMNLINNPLRDDMDKKSLDGWRGIMTTRLWFPNVDCQGTVTVNLQNFHLLPDLVDELHEWGAFCGINFIHYNKDGEYDFFPEKDDLRGFLFNHQGDRALLELTLQEIVDSPNSVQNIEMLEYPIDQFLDMEWHCRGDPYGGPTIDADGSLRCCGYRKGKITPKMKIWALANRDNWDIWREYVYQDAMSCPGCGWSYPWMYKYWKDRDSDFGKKIFINHAGKHIPESSWSRRNIQ